MASVGRLPLVEPDDPDTPPEVVKRMPTYEPYEGPNNVVKALANHPEILRGFQMMSGALYGSDNLSPAQRELAYTTASAINECFY